MLKRFGRSAAKTAKPAAESITGRSPVSLDERRCLPRPLPIPAIVEGNEDADWAMWEESVWSLEVQMLSRRRHLQRPAPIPEAVEGCEDADWLLWEDSVWSLEKRMQSEAHPVKPSKTCE